jgi:hypothetical protein
MCEILLVLGMDIRLVAIRHSRERSDKKNWLLPSSVLCRSILTSSKILGIQAFQNISHIHLPLRSVYSASLASMKVHTSTNYAVHPTAQSPAPNMAATFAQPSSSVQAHTQP